MIKVKLLIICQQTINNVNYFDLRFPYFITFSTATLSIIQEINACGLHVIARYHNPLSNQIIETARRINWSNILDSSIHTLLSSNRCTFVSPFKSQSTVVAQTCAHYKITGKCQDRYYYEHARSSAADYRMQSTRRLASKSMKIREKQHTARIV